MDRLISFDAEARQISRSIKDHIVSDKTAGESEAYLAKLNAEKIKNLQRITESSSIITDKTSDPDDNSQNHTNNLDFAEKYLDRLETCPEFIQENPQHKSRIDMILLKL